MAPAKLTEEDLVVAATLGNLLVNEGHANLRTGGRRTVAKARKIAKAAAEDAGIEVTTSEQDGFLYVKVK